MSIMDPGWVVLGDELTALLITEPGAWRDELDSMFQVRRYGMDARLHGLNFSELTYDGSASNIGGALVQIASRFKQQPLAGVLLLSDGNTTGDMDLSALDFLVYRLCIRWSSVRINPHQMFPYVRFR